MGALFTRIAQWIGRIVGLSAEREIFAIQGALVTLTIFIGLFLTFTTAINAILGSLASQAPAQGALAAGLSLLPNNFGAIFSQIIAAQVAGMFFRYKMQALRILASARNVRV
ncbi:DUF5455 family protein [Plesiomonas sp. ZOR0011]|uniref:DUF5455 family protein n=1 Tax=Plesiomonas sp. ZOR0011 TaxID=1339230 RepID=UPI000645B1A0|nr:DUF5455 family protein [Plesiomonas sp. ZOR0011]